MLFYFSKSILESSTETVDQENEMNNTSSNRNESFINTAAKLLEKAKQNQLNQMEELNKHEKTKQDIIQLQQQNGNIFKKNEELVQN